MKPRYWHFVREDRRLGYNDNRVVRVGRTYRVDCEPVLCHAGLHACKNPLDALRWAPGPVICRVELGGKIVHGDDKSVATERKVIWTADATKTLREFARKCALDVVHLWDAPDIVIDYLKTGDENLRAATLDATLDAARDATLDAALAATLDAARVAARDAAWDATLDAARDATLDAALGAARDATLDAALGAARDAAWAAALDAARAAQAKRLEKMLLKLKGI